MDNSRTPPDRERDQLTITLLSSSDGAEHTFRVSSQITVECFLELAIARLSEGDGAERVEALKRYYIPVLELHDADGADQALPLHATLAKSGIPDGAIVRIAARPRKERIMFCCHRHDSTRGDFACNS